MTAGTPPLPPPEEIVAAAIGQDGLVFMLPRPARHNDLIRAMVKAGIRAPVKGRQGFVTSRGRFVERNEASRVAYGSGQTNRLLANLHSEDVW